ncbi:hypothetical protein BJX99DRAFT_267916 [Aspergillus californicus]
MLKSTQPPPPGHADRTVTIPPHIGDNVLPNLPFFDKLVRYAHREPPRIAIRDLNAVVGKSYLQLLTDALALRRVLRDSLGHSTREKLDNDEEVFIALIAPGGYEYAMAFIATLALGAAVVPITPALPVEEAKSLVLRARCVAIISSISCTDLARNVGASISRTPGGNIIPHLTASHHLQPKPLQPHDIVISSNKVPNMNAAALVIFTSGTTGPPKGAVQRRSYITGAAEDVADHYRITESDTVLHMLPVHHATGIGVTFIPFLVSGACVEFRSGSFDPAWTWDRWRRGGLTFFSGVPTIYTRIMRHFETIIAVLSHEKQMGYLNGARSLRVLLCGTSALPSPVQEFWTKILAGKPILTRYGGTEFHTVLKADLEHGKTPATSVGRISPGVSLKLNDEGMILVKGPHMFSKYLHDEPATTAAHDADGYFITGDIARREGDNYFILGRASVDIIKSGGYKLSALDIEREMLGLEYISEVMVVGVDDDEYGQRVAAAVTLKDGHGGLSLGNLRQDLKERLARYKMPTILRVLDGEIPKTGTGKVQKKILGPRYFPSDYRMSPDVQIWERGKAKL